MSMVKHATRFQMAIYLHQGYHILDWGSGQAGLYLESKLYWTDWSGTFLLNPNKQFKTGTKLAASGTREELEAFVAEFE